ncbi:MAG: zinc-ribbon domain-containing protein [Candidatus Adiutrix sp.]|jgi:predicted Zn finger-like uncharacterized protein|nr:zinc-ribbon domain-containing protein [Candidatus Adiutrix sp.]
MIITCSQCEAKFKIAPEQIKETGSKVRCSNCRHVFTVYRPSPPAEAPVNDRPRDLDLGATPAGASAIDYGLDDLFRDTAPALAAGAHDPLDDDAFYDDLANETMSDYMGPDDLASLKERRDRRRQLYADLSAPLAEKPAEDHLPDGTPNETQDQAPEEDWEDDDQLPRLRRARAEEEEETEEDDLAGPAAEGDGSEDEEYDEDGPAADDEADEASEDEEYDEAGPAAEESAEEEAAEDDNFVDHGDHGLSADPTAAAATARLIDDAEYGPKGFPGGLTEGPAIRAAVVKATEKSPLPLICGLVVLALILAGGIYFVSSSRQSPPQALSESQETAEGPPAVGDQPEIPPNDDGDSNGALKLSFSQREKQNHFFRENKGAGHILVITGMVRNDYPDRRSFIRLRGHILDKDGATLADRFVYAGNIISEEDLAGLPMKEITTRLNLRGGQNDLNMNIKPGNEIPFMLVFDKLPATMAEYRVDAVGSSPANQ